MIFHLKRFQFLTKEQKRKRSGREANKEEKWERKQKRKRRPKKDISFLQKSQGIKERTKEEIRKEITFGFCK